MELNTQEKNELLSLARNTIEQALGKSREEDAPPLGPALQQKGGAFVTLHKNGQLRGCIGNFPGSQPLEEVVRQMAKAAAFNDPRFAPLKLQELEEVDVEISVLSPLVKADPSMVEVGKHGIYLMSPRGRGVLLPQVAVEQGWDQLTFLQQTCRKAGLPVDAWQDEDVSVYLFTAQVFGEKDLNQPA